MVVRIFFPQKIKNTRFIGKNYHKIKDWNFTVLLNLTNLNVWAIRGHRHTGIPL